MDYIVDFNEIIELIETARQNALQKVNEELINLYWNVGKFLSDRIANAKWGDSVIDDLSEFISQNHPQIKGFNRRGLYRMRQFYETYKDNEFVTPLVTQISWTAFNLSLFNINSLLFCNISKYLEY
ncbi:DUF1016 N-terminal domain-containing protein [Pseudobacteroides cellulosolvens]|uniref:YhcG N-terminal domain-containing protein n=1 Tax=Pseudobacteroides cellulosolvens ATCC 35603 = DSM 2933 TaxID=398512 RepID=A0A0L6JUA7_9FIRM|nr:DUF1016 N-terminal domain-containing protein [Pseudobacteroides cellulosolvens]KNY29230.1 protein of unknown function DUF1016 [Pseudobacteroides cellulosolvens ATCC 35603 = DSM 2933]